MIKKSKPFVAFIAISFLLSNELFAQNLDTTPVELSIRFSGSSASDPSKPNVEITVTNISDHNVKIMKPRSDGVFENLAFMVIPAGGDTLFVEVESNLAQSLTAGRKIQTKNLHVGEGLTCVVDLFSGEYGTELRDIGTFQVQAIYQSVYRMKGGISNPRASVWREDVLSNTLLFTQ